MLATERQLEDWIAEDPNLLGLNILLIGRQVQTDFGGRIDLLGMTSGGDLSIIELKRDRTPRDIIAQVLDYASWVSSLTTPQIHDLALRFLRKELSEAFRERFDSALPETLNANHSMVIVASEFDASSSRIVEYLAEEHDIAINTAFFNFFDDGGQQYLVGNWLMDQQEVEERSDNRTKAPWTGLWYVNVGDGPHRSWEDMRKHGFLAAGGGRRFSAPLEKLKQGDPVFAYQKQAGYVGFGRVTDAAVMVRDFRINGDPLISLPLRQPNLAHDRDDQEKAEYVVGVDWEKTFHVSDAKSFEGAFANQNVVCRLRDPRTIEFLKQAFDVSL
jgi:hypothetical protein